jgi:hypothetical protein
MALLAQHIKDVPMLAAGGIMNGQQVAAALAAGAPVDVACMFVSLCWLVSLADAALVCSVESCTMVSGSAALQCSRAASTVLSHLMCIHLHMSQVSDSLLRVLLFHVHEVCLLVSPAGAAAVQVGTAFLTTAEAGTPQPGRQLLLQDHTRGTTVTQVRGITCRSCMRASVARLSTRLLIV